MREAKVIFILLVLFFLSNIFPQNKYTINLEVKEKQLPLGLKQILPADKPQIALALSGGGARSLSQIGVLKAFEESGIGVDIIVGTSMGSIVGGLYSAGYTPDQMDSIALNTDWNDLLTFGNQSNRRDLFVDQKVTEDRAILTLRLNGFNPIIPTSFNDGQKLSNQLNLLVFNAPLHTETSFDLLTKKFRAVCTDLITGNAIVLDKGSLSNALRASSSVTFFLAPIKMDSLLLVDGGLVANIPVDIARQNGGDFVIAVNTSSPLWDESKLDAPWIVADQIVSIPMKLNNEDQLSRANFIITPELENALSTDFSRVDSLIAAGYLSAKKTVNELKNKLDSLNENAFNHELTYFKNILTDTSLTETEKKFFKRYADADSISNKEIYNYLKTLFETGNYKSLTAVISPEDQKNVLTLIKEENPVIKDVSLIGVSLIHSDKISEIFSYIKDKPFCGKRVLDALLELISLYRKDGYSLAEIQSIEFKEEESKLIVFVDEGIISRIEVDGNSHTNKNVILREIPLAVGEFFKIQNVSQGLINLRSTKLFDNIDITVKEDNGQNVLTVNVSERPTSLLRLGFRADNEYRAQFSLDIREENLLGTGSELGIILFGGLKNRAYILEQKANRIFNTYITYKINAFYKFNDVTVYKDVPVESEKRFSRTGAGEYRQIFYGLSLGVGTQVGRFGNILFEGKLQRNEIKNTEEQPITPGKVSLFSFKVSSTIDTQDKYPYPDEGIYFKGSYETAQTVLGGELGYSNILMEYWNYFKLGERHIVSPKIIFGFADKTLPLSEQYALGGQESFFGMHEYEFRGRQIFLASLMYRYKLPFKIFFDTYFKFRYDLGNTWAEQEQIRFKDLRHGIGGAVSFATPIGPAEFAVGRSFLFRKDLPENPISWGDVLFYFSIGYYY